ncbi:MAG: hypothetical protein WD971_05475 [Pirellulales bacterium]
MLRLSFSAVAACVACALASPPCQATFHLWHVKEVFSNADGSVQFIELFDSGGFEDQVGGKVLRTNSDGTIKNFTIPSNLSSTATVNTHFLVATPTFASLAGAVAPNYTLSAAVLMDGPFFNPNATNITISFLGSGDTMTFAGTLLPKDGFNSLTDANAFGLAMNNPNNISVTPNSPTRFPNSPGQIDLRPPVTTGDYNEDGTVDAADYTVWRDTFGQAGVPLGSGADGVADGTIDSLDYDFWKLHFGEVIGGAGSGGIAAAAIVPEPAALALSIPGILALILAAVRARSIRVRL